MKKRPYREGDWFAVPLGGGGFAVGLVVRMAPHDSILFGYFFGPRRVGVPSLDDVRNYHPHDAILVEKFGDLSLRDEEWPILGRLEPWNRAQWPMPAFGRDLRELADLDLAFRVEYPDDNPNGVPRETRISPEEAAQLPPDGVSGAKAVEIGLTMLLGSADDLAELRVMPALGDILTPPMIDHYLYFPTKREAIAVVRTLKDEGYIVEVRDSRDMDAGWLVLARRPLLQTDEDLDTDFARMEELAIAHRGTYDGHERDMPRHDA